MVSGQGDCAKLIQGQRAKLMHIRLSATSWAEATYHALSKVTGLQTLAVNVHCLTTSSADSIASLQRPHGIHVVLRKSSDSQRSMLQSLSGCSKVTELTLIECTFSILEGLGTMPHLTSLTIVRSAIDSTMLQLQPGITHLTLLDCDQTDQRLRCRHVDCNACPEKPVFRASRATKQALWAFNTTRLDCF